MKRLNQLQIQPFMILLIFGGMTLVGWGAGRASAIVETSVATPVLTFDFETDQISPVYTSEGIVVSLPTGMIILGSSRNGVVALRDETTYYRWRHGQTESLAEYRNDNPIQGGATWVNTKLSIGPDGTIVVLRNEQTSVKDEETFASQDENDQTMTLWPGNGGSPRSRSSPAITASSFFTDAFPAALQTSKSNEHFSVIAGPDGAAYGHVISGLRTESFDGFPSSTWQTTVFRFGPDGSFSLGLPLGDWNRGQVSSVSDDGRVIGSWEDASFTRRYFVGESEVTAYTPAEINGAGDVIGISEGAWWVYPLFGGRTALPSSSSAGDSVVAWTWDGQDRLVGFVRMGSSFPRRLFVPLTDSIGWADYAFETVQLPEPMQTSLALGPGNVLPALGTLTGAEGVLPFLWLPGALRVDADRDGRIAPRHEIENSDQALARQNLPWFFWTNHDDDAAETGGIDLPAVSSPDAADLVVDGVRDLVDFFAVQLEIPAVVQVFPPSQGFTYNFIHSEQALNVLESTLGAEQVGAYHRDPATAAAQAIRLVRRVTEDGISSSDELAVQLEQTGTGILLCEARVATQAPLRLQIRQGVGGALVGEFSLPLSIANVDTMFRHVNIVGAVGQVPATTNRAGALNLPPAEPEQGDFVFVHGYNVNQELAQGWHAEVFKRLWVMGLTDRFWGVTWYGTESQKKLPPDRYVTGDYHSNVVNAFGTAPALVAVLNQISSEAGREPTVMGHSLGNLVISAALSDFDAPASRYFMVNGALAAEAYDPSTRQASDQAATLPHTAWTREDRQAYPSRLWSTEWYRLFPESDSRRALTWQDRFPTRAETRYFNFYSEGEEVFADDPGDTPSLGLILWKNTWEYLTEELAQQQGRPAGSQAWIYQEKFKGRTLTGKVLGSRYGGWGFNRLVKERRPGGIRGLGPKVRFVSLDAEQAVSFSAMMEDEDFQAVPFFRPGSDRIPVATWVPRADGSGGQDKISDRLGALYTPGATGEAFAQRHRDSLLARMIPAQSLAAGRVAVPDFEQIGGANFDMNAELFRTRGEGPLKWPSIRGPDTSWRHSDLREIALPFVSSLYLELGKPME